MVDIPRFPTEFSPTPAIDIAAAEARFAGASDLSPPDPAPTGELDNPSPRVVRVGEDAEETGPDNAAANGAETEGGGDVDADEAARAAQRAADKERFADLDEPEAVATEDVVDDPDPKDNETDEQRSADLDNDIIDTDAEDVADGSQGVGDGSANQPVAGEARDGAKAEPTDRLPARENGTSPADQAEAPATPREVGDNQERRVAEADDEPTTGEADQPNGGRRNLVEREEPVDNVADSEQARVDSAADVAKATRDETTESDTEGAAAEHEDRAAVPEDVQPVRDDAVAPVDEIVDQTDRQAQQDEAADESAAPEPADSDANERDHSPQDDVIDTSGSENGDEAEQHDAPGKADREENARDNPEGDDADTPEGKADEGDATKKPLTTEQVVDGIDKVIDEKNKDPDNVSKAWKKFLKKIARRGIEDVHGDIDDIRAEIDGIPDSEAIQDTPDDDIDSSGGSDVAPDADKEPEPTGDEARLKYEELQRQHDEVVEEYKNSGLEPDSIAGRKLISQAEAISAAQLRIMSKDAYDAYMGSKEAVLTRQRGQESRIPDDRLMELMPHELESLRTVATEQRDNLNEEAPGSALKWDKLTRTIDDIDLTLDKWREVFASKNPAERAWILTRDALGRVIKEREQNRDTQNTNVLSQIKAELRGIPNGATTPAALAARGLARRLILRDGERRSLDVDGKSKLRGSASADLRAAKALLKQLGREGEKTTLNDINERRAQAVPKRRDALAKAVQADKMNARDPSLLVKGRGNAWKGARREAVPFGQRRTPAKDRSTGPSIDGSQNNQATGAARVVNKLIGSKEQRQKRRELRLAQAEVDKARAALNRHPAGKRLLARFVPLAGKVFASNTAEAQADLRVKIARRDMAFVAAHPRLAHALGM